MDSDVATEVVLVENVSNSSVDVDTSITEDTDESVVEVRVAIVVVLVRPPIQQCSQAALVTHSGRLAIIYMKRQYLIYGNI